jgi:hypothetical protein
MAASNDTVVQILGIVYRYLSTDQLLSLTKELREEVRGNDSVRKTLEKLDREATRIYRPTTQEPNS